MPVRVGERLRVEPRDGAERDRDAEDDHQPRQEIRTREPACVEVGRQARVPRRTAAISSTRVRRESRSRHSGVRLDVRQPAVAPARVELVERGPDRGRVVGRRDDARTGLADQLRRRPVGRHHGEDRTADGDVLEHLSREDPLPAPVGLGDQEEERLRVALERERRRSAARTGSARAGRRARAVAPIPGRRRGSRRGSGSRRRAPSRERAWRNGRGSRRPKKLPVCVSRNRSDGDRSSPTTSSKSQPFGIVTTGPRGPSDRVSSEIASETHVIASAREATSCATRRCVAAFALVATVSARRWACATSESRRSATQRAPVARAIAAAMRWVEGGGDVETTTSISCSRTSRMPGGDGRHRPRRVLVRQDEAPQLQAGLRQRRARSPPSRPAPRSASRR